MSLPASGAIALSQIGTEFSVGTPIAMSDLYVGGAHVKNTMSVAGVPAAGAISVSDFYGTSVAPLAATVAPTSLSGSDDQQPVTTAGSATCTPSGGSAPYAYLWELVSGEASIVPVSASAATTLFTANLPGYSLYQAVYRCKVTDSGAQVTYSNNVTISLELTW